jgi:hypothetical protein
MYNQCLLSQGDSIQVAWIPSEFAKKGKKILLKKAGKVWTVAEVYGKADKASLDFAHSAYRRFDKVLDPHGT